MPLDKWPGASPVFQTDVVAKTRRSGADVIKLKGGAGFAVGIAVREVVHSIALDRGQVLPVSTLQNGAYTIQDVSLSVPTVVGRKGAGQRIEFDLWPKELRGMQNSARVLSTTLGQIPV